MNHHPPRDLLEVLQKIEYEDALNAEDTRYVETLEARGGDKTLDRLARKFGLMLADGRFFPPLKRHVLFFGHIGSGKTTELRRYAAQLGGPQRFLVVEVDIAAELDRNNVKYADILMAMARALFAALLDKGVQLDDEALSGLETWFAERVTQIVGVEEFAADIKSSATLGGGIPGLLALFGRFTGSFRANKTYKDELRKAIRNTFGELAKAFNRLLRDAEERMQREGIARRILFIVDGTDKLRGEDTRDFFVHDAEQLQAIEAHVIYTAPLSLKYERNLAGGLDADLVLPMIKLYQRDGSPWSAGWTTMEHMLARRVAPEAFAGDEERRRLIEYSGGHPREMLRLLKLCCEYAEGPSIDAATLDQAIRQLASEYRRFLEPDDYKRLADTDAGTVQAGNDERTCKLLYNLALLEYNDGSWQRSHPVVRELEGYRQVYSC